MPVQESINIHQKVEASLDSIRPYLEADGGNIEIVDITHENVVIVRLIGACESCKMSFTTMKAGVEAAVIKAVPEIKSVVAINASSPD